ncbi:hypothetical protein F6J84_08065 [Microbacterium caowuchunii]|uniref:hypothetical protein n=1 Tax=Microbacterium caowuchunii TaxID=2614638 RepID=UPI001245A06D|nr:hypothetical protein [Microbacterium caowuchunii]QEW00063.1 hypothetical protein F6J84_08065 [Microbacterium caowuchunii]
MRDLTPDDLGVLLSLFAVLLLAFGLDFHLSKRSAARHRERAVVFVLISVLGQATTALSLVLTWVAVWSPIAWERIDDLLVFIPGSIAVLCAVILTGETTVVRMLALLGSPRSRDRSASRGSQPLETGRN